ncbi:hypothetical protein BGX38DRAFT_1318785 [Terfezia claveryi]|nr:hypothetical protein BGX38DRAFT_1318785 [Terfezia claveryi]
MQAVSGLCLPTKCVGTKVACMLASQARGQHPSASQMREQLPSIGVASQARGQCSSASQARWQSPSASQMREQLPSIGVASQASCRIAANVKIVELESGEPPEVEDQLSFEVNLRKELKHSYKRLEVSENKRLRVGGLLRDSSVELADPLSPAVDNSILGEEEAETQDQENAAGQEDAEAEENAGSEDEL